jgi:hypothetical protein
MVAADALVEPPACGASRPRASACRTASCRAACARRFS